MTDQEMERHLANAGNPQGSYGASLLDVMNTGEHEKLSTWGFEALAKDFVGGCVGEGASHAGGPRVLDLGCGGGANLVRLHSRFGGHVTGLDHSPVSVEKSRATCEAALPVDAWEVVQGDVAALPFTDSSFGLVSAFETLYFWPDPEAAVAEARRVLVPGGIFFVCNEAGGTQELPDWAKTLNLYHEDELVALLEQMGFSLLQTQMTDEGWLCATATPRT